MQECVQRLFHPSIKLIASFLVQPIRLREGETNGISENSKILDDELFVLLLIINQHLLTLSINKQLQRDTSSASFAFNIEALCHSVRTKINRICEKINEIQKFHWRCKQLIFHSMSQNCATY